MTAAKSEKPWTPFGLPRVVVAALYFFAVCVTGLASQAADPLQELMKLNGAYSDIEDPTERSAIISSVVGLGISFSVLSGVGAGLIMDLLKPKLSGLLGLALHTLGYVFLFLTDIRILYYLSGMCFGLAFQLLINSHMTIGCLFPRNANLVLCIITAGPDLSLFIPPVILSFAKSYGGSGGVRYAVVQYLLIFVTAAAVIDILLLPFSPFVMPKRRRPDPEEQPLSTDMELDAEDTRIRRTTVASSIAPLSVGQQLRTLDYWVFIPFFVLSFLRKKHFSILIRSIFMELDSSPDKSIAPWYVSFYNQVVPYGFLPAILWGSLVDRFGIIPLMFVSNTLGVVYSLTSLVPWMPLQFVTVGVYIIHQSFIVAQAFAFLASTYGFSTLAALQGIASTIVGLASIAMDAGWPQFISHVLQSYWNASLLMVAVGLILYIFPLLLLYLSNARAKEAAVEEEEGHEMPVSEFRASVVMSERASLAAIQEIRKYSSGN